jgi:hypothetical protein
VTGYRKIASFVGFLLTILIPTLASGHEIRPALLEIKETAPHHYNLLWRTPVMAGMRLPVVLGVPDARDLRTPAIEEFSDSLAERRWIDAGPQGLTGKRIEFVGLQLTITDVLVRVELLDGREWTTFARPSQPGSRLALRKLGLV